MKVTVLGCGSSGGVPLIGCECKICKSGKEKNIRTRSSILIETDKLKLLVDTGPDFRQQALRHNIKTVDAIFYTHEHADHVMGIDDIRSINFYTGKSLNCYFHRDVYEYFLSNLSYIFANKNVKKTIGSIPIVNSNILESREGEFEINDKKIQYFEQDHGFIKSYGLRIGDFIYSTDVKFFPKATEKYLYNADVWILDYTKYKGAPTHASYEVIIEWIEKFKPKQVYLTHMSHEIDYDELDNMSPPHVKPAYDGLILHV